MAASLATKARQIALNCLDYINKGPSPWHVVSNSRSSLLNKGFQELHEIENWKLENGGKYFFTRNNSTLIAFTVGNAFRPNNTGFKIIGAHTDSPCLRLAPVSKLTAHNYNQACVQTYGGGIFATWLDRDLTVAGRIIYKNDKGNFDSKLVHIPRSICSIPNLCIHLKGGDEKKKLEPNWETHLRPIFSTTIYDAFTEKKETEGSSSPSQLSTRHYSGLIKLISQESGIAEQNIVDLDLCFADVQPGQLIGIHEEFISSPRLDNLSSCYNALDAILSEEAVEQSNSFVNLVCLFDHEEIGSQSAQGADSKILSQNLRRIYNLLKNQYSKEVLEDSYEKAIQQSFCISADQAHAIHPNYAEKHQINHQVKLNKGVVLKINANQRYATDSVGLSIMKTLGQNCSVPLQEYIVKNDSPCGSTIGPITAGQTGIKTVDIGAAQLAMHSIRETGGVLDAYYYNTIMKEFFKSYQNIDRNLLYN